MMTSLKDYYINIESYISNFEKTTNQRMVSLVCCHKRKKAYLLQLLKGDIDTAGQILSVVMSCEFAIIAKEHICPF